MAAAALAAAAPRQAVMVARAVFPVVVAVLARMVFDFAIWSRNEPQRPILLV